MLISVILKLYKSIDRPKFNSNSLSDFRDTFFTVDNKMSNDLTLVSESISSLPITTRSSHSNTPVSGVFDHLMKADVV